MSCLNKLPIDASHIQNSHTVMQAFDRTCKSILGNITILLQIGPCIYEVNFYVMDIALSYNYLLRRLLIYSVRAVPLSLHQKLKFVIRNKVVSIGEEEYIIAATSINTLYVEPDEGILKPFFNHLSSLMPPMLKKDCPWLNVICQNAQK